MRKFSFLFVLFFFFFSSPRLSFSYSRQEVIARALTAMEIALSADNIQQGEYFAQGRDKRQIFLPAARAERKPQDTREEAMACTFYIASGFDMNYMHYSEWEGKDKPDEDFGHQGGYYLSLGYRSPNYYEALKGRPFIEGYMRRYGDVIHYKGRITGGASFNMDERSQVTQFGAKLGAYADFTDKGELLGYVDIGKRTWDRGEDERIGSVQTYREIYKWVYTGLGTGINYKFLPELSAGIDGELLFTYQDSRRMHANIIDLTYKLGTVWGIELKAPIKYALLKNLTLDLTPYFTYWHIKHSEYIDIGGGLYSYEPDSKTHIEGLLTGVTCYF